MQHVLHPLWESIKPSEISLQLSVGGEELEGTTPFLLESFQGGVIGFKVTLKRPAEANKVYVSFRQSRHWSHSQILLKPSKSGVFAGSVRVAPTKFDPRETFQFEALVYGPKLGEDPRPIGRSKILTIVRSKSDKIPATNWSHLPQYHENFAASTDVRLRKANGHLWRLLFESGRVAIYWNINGERQEHCDLLRARQADATREAIRSLLNALVARSAMATQQTWDMLQSTNLQSTDSSAYAQVPMIRALKLAAQLTPGTADLDNLGSLLCEIEYQERAKQKTLNAQINRSLKILAGIN